MHLIFFVSSGGTLMSHDNEIKQMITQYVTTDWFHLLIYEF